MLQRRATVGNDLRKKCARKSSTGQVLRKLRVDFGKFRPISTRHRICNDAGGTVTGFGANIFNEHYDKNGWKMHTNQSNRFSNGVQPNLEWRTATQHDANYGNFMADFSVKEHDMNVPPSPNTSSSPSRVLNIRCAAPQAPAWEYKIGIALANSSTARKDAQEFFSKAWGRRGWLFVSESGGIFHFKRLKR